MQNRHVACRAWLAAARRGGNSAARKRAAQWRNENSINNGGKKTSMKNRKAMKHSPQYRKYRAMAAKLKRSKA